ncbi:hypothetical protein [Actinomadura rubrisoli]|uniref:Uncharacterized protein n=1 Tax=Actinomadura rubrisoli TaxID=2530368 RepID=A0A4R5CFB1_9ACTN|nr:hypothetical protein [Actinomadura rubrisoli]TDD97646.1 hypothetical protein E1298_01025 [Actinomadura rubrisoli]
MLDFFRGSLSAEAILDFLQHLPSTSAYSAALAEDEDLAKELLDEPDRAPSPPRLTEFGPEVQALAEVRDLLASVLAVLVKANGGKPQKPKPYPRPVTALQKLKRRMRYSRHLDVVRRVLPGRSS